MVQGANLCLLSCQQFRFAQHSPDSVKRGVYTCAGFYGYTGEGFSLLLPSQWNPSKEREEPGVVLRYEDNGDSVNHVVVISRKADKGSIEGYGSPEEFLNKISSLLGKQVFVGGQNFSPESSLRDTSDMVSMPKQLWCALCMEQKFVCFELQIELQNTYLFSCTRWLLILAGPWRRRDNV